jgi:DNA-binding transcriptional regulator YiaG
MSKKYRSDAMAAIHETMQALRDVGAIDKKTMRRFDVACLTPIRPLKPKQIKAPNRFCQLPERDEQFSQQVGTRRKAAFWAIAQAPIAGREEWACCRYLVA